MTDATVLGAGVMGSALVRSFVRAGHDVTVWNRSPGRADPLAEAGARLVRDLGEATAASPLIVLCVTGPLPEEIPEDLAGRTFVQLSTCTPRVARAQARELAARGADVLHGVILATPSQIGTPSSHILASGSATAHAEAAPLLGAAAPVQLVGSDPGAAAAFDLGILVTLFGALAGSFHAARLFEAEGLPVDELGRMLQATAPTLGEMLAQSLSEIHMGSWGSTESSLETCRQALLMLESHAAETEIDAQIPHFLRKLFDRGVEAGLSAQSPSAMIQVLRAAGGRT